MPVHVYKNLDLKFSLLDGDTVCYVEHICTYVVLFAKWGIPPLSVEYESGEEGDEHPEPLHCPELEQHRRAVTSLKLL
jgi:hypothetical protein